MSISREAARQCEGHTDRPELHAAIQSGLQKFMNDMAREGFKLPLEVCLIDAHGDLLREFTVQSGGKKVLGHSSNKAALFVFPLTAVAQDGTGRIAVLHLATQDVFEVVKPDARVEFVN
jgi:hypothetical protein